MLNFVRIYAIWDKIIKFAFWRKIKHSKIFKLVDCQTGEDLAEIKPNPFIENSQNDEPPPHGELWLRSDCVMAGYLNESDGLNQRTIDQEGWFHTGECLIWPLFPEIIYA
jgi:long-subunit acyl-CoA synthetase (AMP-forming)